MPTTDYDHKAIKTSAASSSLASSPTVYGEFINGSETAATTTDVITESERNNYSEQYNFQRCSGWNIKASYLAKNTRNRIRQIVESLQITPNPEKPMIPLSIGDPTTFGNLKASAETIKALSKSLESGQFNGYAHSQGHEVARKAIARYSAHQSASPISTDDIFICSGCSAALEYCILALVDRGQNLLVPRPGFCLYQTLSEGLGIEVRYYDLLPEKQWQADLKQLEGLIDGNTAALLINNPSNPCGSVFPEQHLRNLIAICERHFLPIIADEIYEHFVFPGSKHIAVSSLSKQVPVLSCGGLTKRFLVPGWRMGWIIVHDREQRLRDAVVGIKNMCCRIAGSNTIVQGALPDILDKAQQCYFESVIDVVYSNAKMAYKLLHTVRGLKPVMPSGAMYMMVGIDIEHFPEFRSDTHFMQELVNEQSVFCLPGSCFEYMNNMRIVLTVPGHLLEEACHRIAEFCDAHYKVDARIIEHELLSAVKY